jgi:hypothetical protein
MARGGVNQVNPHPLSVPSQRQQKHGRGQAFQKPRTSGGLVGPPPLRPRVSCFRASRNRAAARFLLNPHGVHLRFEHESHPPAEARRWSFAHRWKSDPASTTSRSPPFTPRLDKTGPTLSAKTFSGTPWALSKLVMIGVAPPPSAAPLGPFLNRHHERAVCDVPPQVCRRFVRHPPTRPLDPNILAVPRT